MPYATSSDNILLHYEEAGSGVPILFVHEFAGDHRSWEPQMRYFSRSHRCIAYSARGYTPSDVPDDVAAYSYRHFMGDAVSVLDHLKIAKAHIVGLSMGGYTAVQIGINHPDRALSLTAAGAGSGSERWLTEEFRRGALATADIFASQGSAEVARTYGLGPGRVPFHVKDPRGFDAFNMQFAEHDAKGSAHTMRGFQAERPSLYDFETDIRRIAAPTLIAVGDEDDPCIEPSLLLKQWIAASGLAVFPKTGHVVNLEEPDLFNRTLAEFLARVEAGRWPPRDPRSKRPREVRPAT
jgi:proline iminopeptidase